MGIQAEKAVWRPLLAWAGGGLVAKLLWEVLQRPLYAGYREAGWVFTILP